jgi:hypothetical protein
MADEAFKRELMSNPKAVIAIAGVFSHGIF